MRLPLAFARDLSAFPLLVGLAIGASTYANPYSFHQVIAVPYDQFRTVPAGDGRVHVEGQVVDFRLPRPTLSAATRAESLRRFGQDVTRLVAAVRQHLNGIDGHLPRPATTRAEDLWQEGRERFCLCSDYAIVLNELLQACGLQARVVWLEGHVLTEYVDPALGRWVLLDAHMNVFACGPAGERLSVAETVQRMERDEPVEFVAITPDEPTARAPRFERSDRARWLWYRNVLLNGECYVLSGSTLQYPSRWTHVVKFRTAPQQLLLKTDFDSSDARYLEPFSARKTALLACSFIALFLVARFPYRAAIRAGWQGRARGAAAAPFAATLSTRERPAAGSRRLTQ